MAGSPPQTEILRLPLGRRVGRGSPLLAASVAGALVLGAIVVAVGPWPGWVRAVVGAGLVGLAAAASQVLGRRHQPPRGWLVVDGDGVHRADRGRTTALVDWAEPFGVTVLASADRASILVAVTSPRATRYLSARVRDAEDAAAAPTVLECATTAAASDLREEDDLALSAADAEQFIAALTRLAPAALDRIYLSDVGGEAVVLDCLELRVGDRRIDLAEPLEWRTSLFQERGPHAATVCQATWVRQAGEEIVFVAPMPADGGWTYEADAAVRAAGEGAAVRRSVTRDLRLIRAVAAEAPARETRHAIDRVFMLPLRRALDQAPRASRVTAPARAKATSHPA